MYIYAIVKRKKGERKGKGSSRAELKEVCISTTDALQLDIPIDIRRSTKHEKNVHTLQIYVESLKSEPSLPIDEIETIQLTEVKGIGPKTMEKLVDAGIMSVNELVEIDTERIAEVISISNDRTSTLIENARSLLN